MATEYRFSFGPWNLHEGADPFGPAVRQPRELAEKLEIAVRLGFHGIQFHDDDVAPDLVWVSRERLPGLLQEDGHLHGAPDLIVEVLYECTRDLEFDAIGSLEIGAVISHHLHGRTRKGFCVRDEV